MIKAIKLDPKRTILDLKIGSLYIAKYKNRRFYLNENIKAETKQEFNEGELRAVRISKIQIPDTVVIEVVNDEFVIAQDNIVPLKDDEPTTQIPEKFKPVTKSFSWDNKTLEDMRPGFEKATVAIRKAIFTKQPIILRHHSDVDGYIGGMCLDRAIKPILQKEHGDYVFRFYSKHASKTPFYDYVDATKDIEFALNNSKRFGHKTPLIVLIDLGSGEENLTSIEMARIFGAKVIVIDHHYAGELVDGKSKVCKPANIHINPFLKGSDSRWTGGMLGYEMARMINKDTNYIDILPGISGIADKSFLYEEEIFGHYIGLARKQGYTFEYMQKLVQVIDFETQSVKYLDIGTIMDELLGYNDQAQKAFVDLIYPKIQAAKDKIIHVAEKFAQVDENDRFRTILLDIEKCSLSGEYPVPRTVVATTHDYFKEKDSKGTITIGKLWNMLIFRCDGVDNFDVNEILRKLREELPQSLADGGGHAAAGAIKYIGATEEEVMALVKGYINNL
ncbi:MAG: hypothetical protein KKG59_01795 [Nanoarchaeota archaeon]|nr:hypothetical protein [Nanoarchaeota archaeon]